MERPEVRQGMDKLGVIISGSTPEQLGALVREQFDSYRATIKAAGIPQD